MTTYIRVSIGSGNGLFPDGSQEFLCYSPQINFTGRAYMQAYLSKETQDINSLRRRRLIRV